MAVAPEVLNQPATIEDLARYDGKAVDHAGFPRRSFWDGWTKPGEINSVRRER